MISDRPMSKLKSSMQMRLSALQFAALLFAVLHAMSRTGKSDAAEDLSGTLFTMFLFSISFLFVLAYILGGPHLVKLEKVLADE